MKARDQQDTLEGMIAGAEQAIDGNVPRPGENLELSSEPVFDIDYDKLTKDTNKQAKKLLKNATGLMLGDEVVKNNPYMKDKINTDVISLGGMLYQMECTKIMQKALMEEVRHGATHNRMFEVFGGLSKIISENNKQLLQTVEAIKTTYLDLRENIAQMNDQKQIGSGIVENNKGFITTGTRELIEESKKTRLLKKQAEVSEAKIVD